MDNQIMTMIVEYRLAIMIGVLVLLILLSKKKSGKNKILLILTVTLALSIIYEVVMDEPANRIPGRISRALNQPSSSSTKSSNPHYHVPPEERYNMPERR